MFDFQVFAARCSLFFARQRRRVRLYLERRLFPCQTEQELEQFIKLCELRAQQESAEAAARQSVEVLLDAKIQAAQAAKDARRAARAERVRLAFEAKQARKAAAPSRSAAGGALVLVVALLGLVVVAQVFAAKLQPVEFVGVSGGLALLTAVLAFARGRQNSPQ